jgi:hypothetical protein
VLINLLYYKGEGKKNKIAVGPFANLDLSNNTTFSPFYMSLSLGSGVGGRGEHPLVYRSRQ